MPKEENAHGRPHGNPHQQHHDSVMAAIEAAGSDPEARFVAFVKAVAKNSRLVNTPKDRDEALTDLEAHAEGLAAFIIRGV